jgi:hypothetical protein
VVGQPPRSRRNGAPDELSLLYIRPMPDFSGSQRQIDSWIASGRPESVLSSLMAAVKNHRGRITDEGPAGFSFESGSRSNYRIMGMWSRAPSRPVLGRVSTTANELLETVEVRAELISNEGWGVVEVNTLVTRQYVRTFGSLFEVLRKAAPETKDTRAP